MAFQIREEPQGYAPPPQDGFEIREESSGFQIREEPSGFQIREEPEKEEESRSIFGDWAHAFYEGVDRSTTAIMALPLLMGGEDNADQIASYYQNIDKPGYMEEYERRIGEASQKWDDAEGFWESAGAIGHGFKTLVSDPKSLAYSIVENVPNFLPSLATGAAGAVAGAPGGPAGMGIGFLLGMSVGTIGTETGHKVLELAQEWGADMKDADSIRSIITSDDFKDEAAKQGIIKGSIIAAVDAASFRVGGKILSAPGKVFERDVKKVMADAGVDVADAAAVATAYRNPAIKGQVAEALETYLRTSKNVSDETITALRKTAEDFTRSTSRTLPRVGRGSAALSVETVGEGVGELLGEAGASGRIEPIEAMHEALAGLGQGAAQIAISKSFEVSKNNTKALLRAARRAQIERVAAGQPSEIEPAALNEALRARMDKVEAGLEGSASVEVLQFERALGSLDPTTRFDSTLARVGELPGYEDYQEVLQRVLNEDFGPEITLYTPMTKAEQATLEAGGVFDHATIASLDATGVTAGSGQEVVRVTVPTENVAIMGDRNRGQLVITPNNLVLAPEVSAEPATPETPDTLSTALEVEQQRLQRVAEEIEIEEAKVLGEREGEAERSVRKPYVIEKALRATRKKVKRALRAFPESKFITGKRLKKYEKQLTISQLKTLAEKKGIPHRDQSKDTLVESIDNWRKALDKPDNILAVNNALKPTGYKLSLTTNKETGIKEIHIVPRPGSKDLVRGTIGSAVIGGRTVSEYAKIIEERQQETAETIATQEALTGVQEVVATEQVKEEARPKVTARNALDAIRQIESNFIKRTDKAIEINENGVKQFLQSLAPALKKKELKSINEHIARVRREKELIEQPRMRRGPLKGRRTIFFETVPSTSLSWFAPIHNLGMVAKERFSREARRIIQTPAGRDTLLAEIAGIYAQQKEGVGGYEGVKNPNALLTLTPKADRNEIADIYSLAVQYIYRQDGVVWSLPDNNLRISDEDVTLGAHLKFKKAIGGANESKFFNDLRKTLGEDIGYTKISPTDIIILNFDLTKTQFARRIGRFYGKTKNTYGFRSEWFTSTGNYHDISDVAEGGWDAETSGESVRDRIRQAGFGNILEYIDSRHEAFIDLAKEYGVEPPGTETATEATEEAAPEAAFPIGEETAKSLGLTLFSPEDMAEGHKTDSPTYVLKSENRAFVLVEVTGSTGETINVPFYISSGRGGKTETKIGQWYPLLGIAKDRHGWLNKGTDEQLANYYGIESLRLAAKKLDSTLGDVRNDPQYQEMPLNYDSITRRSVVIDPAQQLLRKSLEEAGIISLNYSEVKPGDIEAMIAQLREVLETREATEESPPAESLIPPEQPAIRGGFSTSRLRNHLAKRFGRTFRRLEREGIVTLVATVDDLPPALVTDADARQRVRGVYDRRNQKAYLIANRLNAGNAHKILLHEVGAHYGLARMLGNEYSNFLLEIEAGKDTIFKPYYEAVRESYAGRLSETDQAFTEEVIARIAEDTSESTLPLRRRIYIAVRRWLNTVWQVNMPELTDKDIGYLIKGSLRIAARRGRQPPYNLLHGGDPQYGQAVIGFPEYVSPNRTFTIEHQRYEIAEPDGKKLPKDQERRLRRNMNQMMKFAESIGKRFKDVDVHLPIVAPTTNVTSRYVIFRNVNTGTELVARVSNHPKDMWAAAGSYPFVSFNNGHEVDILDMKDMERAVKLLANGKLDGMNGAQAYLEHRLGDPFSPLTHATARRFASYEAMKRQLSPKALKKLAGIETSELNSAAVIHDDAAMFSLGAPIEMDTVQEDFVTEVTKNKKRNMFEHLEESRLSRWDWLVQGMIDTYRPIKQLAKLGADSAQRAWMMMQLSENSGGLLQAVLHFGTPKEVYRDGQFDWYDIDRTGGGLIDILRDLNGEVDNFLAWVVANRSDTLMKEGREKHFTEEQIKAGLRLNKGTMEDGQSRALVYLKAMKRLSKMQESMLDMAENAGVITPELRAEMKTDFYVPFYREFEAKDKEGIQGPTPAHDFVNMRDTIRKLQGSELGVNDVLHNLIMNWTALMSASMKNRAGQAAMEASVEAGVATEIDDPGEAAQIAFSKQRGRKSKFDNYVYVLVNGKRVWYNVHDPLVMNAMTHMAWGGTDGKLLRTMSNFKRVFTFGVTASPAFKIRNLIRDAVHAIAVGKMKYNIFGNVASGLGNMAEGEPIYASMLAGGGGFSFGFLNEDPGAIRRMVKRGVSQSRIIDSPAKAYRILGKLWGGYQEVGNRMENANRAALYMKRRDEVGHMEASFEARDLLNFSSHGRFMFAQYLISAIPFLNARLQGLDKLGRSGFDPEVRARMLSVVGVVTLASIGYFLSMEDDEEYQELEEWVKNTYWPIKVGDTFVFLPKPFEIGAIASVGERITQNFIGGTGVHAAYTAARIREILADQLAFDWRPQVVRPLYEVATNKDAFLDRRIESLSWDMQKVPKTQRKRAYSSEIAVSGSEFMEALLPSWMEDTEMHLSPVQIDHLIRGYTGWLGTTVVGAFDSGIRNQVRPAITGVEPPDMPTKRVDELDWIGPVPFPLKSFISSAPRRNTKYVSLLYEQMAEVKKHYAAFVHYREQGMTDEMMQVLAEHGDLLAWRKTYDKIQKEMGKISKRTRQIYIDKTMTGDEKRKELDRLMELKADVAKRFTDIRAKYDAEERPAQ